MRSRADTPTPPEFEPFLFAEIGKEENGMTLTVASAFARLGLDPWQQAAVLARLSDVAATASLAALIGRAHAATCADTPAGQGAGVAPTGGEMAIASRLVPLLPKAVAARLPENGDAAVLRAPGGTNALWLFWGAVAAVIAYMVWF